MLEFVFILLEPSEKKGKERKALERKRETRAVVFARGVPERCGGCNKEQKRGGEKEEGER